MMNANEWTGTIVGVLTIVGIALVVIRWVIRNEVREIKAETTSNGGGSMNDKIKLEVVPIIKEIRQDQIKIGIDLATLNGKFEQHIREHNE